MFFFEKYFLPHDGFNLERFWDIIKRGVGGSKNIIIEINETKKGYFESNPFCDPGETRTPNLLIRSQMLYPLSYRTGAKMRCKDRKSCVFPKQKMNKK